jgi:glycosyltransferase involved in cell wall biosynthesis
MEDTPEGPEVNGGSQPELSVVIPCLNEADTLAACVERAASTMAAHSIEGEVIVADNGSSDGSVEIAERLGARVVHVAEKGYGSALMGGIAAARGRFVMMGDADGSYDFGEAPNYVAKLREGCDLVQGCRLPWGGGKVLPGAMPFLHRWFGNPLFSILARRMFKAPIHDIYCGMRGFTKEMYERLDQRCTGMEFATEMVLKASLRGERIGEIPITLHPDGRKSHAPHLRTFRDGWRTLRFFLLLSPRWLFLVPGALLILLGLLGYALALPGVQLGPAQLGAHTLLVASLATLCGYQAILFAVFARTYAVTAGILPENPDLTRFFERVNLERGLVISGIAFVTGVGLILVAFDRWRREGFGPLDYAETMRLVIPGTTLTALAFQTVLSSFFVSIMGMQRK